VSTAQHDVNKISNELRNIVRENCCIEDVWPNLAENYRHWVIEDKFVSGRPQWEARGTVFTADVGSFETMKLRLLNAGHSTLAYTGYLLGFRYVDCEMGNCPKFAENSAPVGKSSSTHKSHDHVDTKANPMPEFLKIFLSEQVKTRPSVV
jgi:hypothetical protein